MNEAHKNLIYRLNELREEIEDCKAKVCHIKENDIELLFYKGGIQNKNLSGNNMCSGVTVDMQGVAEENLLLAFHHLEDARMRAGKAIQALKGGVSKFDRDGSNEKA